MTARRSVRSSVYVHGLTARPLERVPTPEVLRRKPRTPGGIIP
jgi:hypothetical protein